MARERANRRSRLTTVRSSGHMIPAIRTCIEYHALLMKLAGIDGVIFDWYGTADYLDYASHPSPRVGVRRPSSLDRGSTSPFAMKIRQSPNSSKAGDSRPSERVEHARREIEWLRKNWFREVTYLKLDDRPFCSRLDETA